MTMEGEDGARRIVHERRRQIQQEGWSLEHDDTLKEHQLTWAAICFAAPDRVYTLRHAVTPADPALSLHDPWPKGLDPAFDKRPPHRKTVTTKQRIRALEKAGALIAAEIDRLLRLTEAEKVHESGESS
jgi:hypothetical protein